MRRSWISNIFGILTAFLFVVLFSSPSIAGPTGYHSEKPKDKLQVQIEYPDTSFKSRLVTVDTAPRDAEWIDTTETTRPLLDRWRGVNEFDPVSRKTVNIPLYRRMYAVVIGINEYPHLSNDKQLTYAVSDAEGVAEALRSRYDFDEVITLYNKEATRNEILRVLVGDIGGEVTEDDAVFVFFAGHGVTYETKRFGKLGWIIPYDGSMERKQSYRNISMETIKNEISREVEARHIFYVFDACYSALLLETRGPGEKNRERSVDYLRELTQEDARQVLTAGNDKHALLDNGEGNHSVF
ncbi:MAG: caspase family protein, partial [Candidatus Lindowbacteria bacterium]|nr:caspase family protein [Candidatus Lindowbacteria bacterium]